MSQGSLAARCVIVTVHDLGTSQLSLSEFFSLPCLDPLTARCLLVHVSLPGQQPDQPDWEPGQTFPSLEDMSEAVLQILEQLNLSEVILLGVGVGANIAVRVCLSSPGKVLGVVVVQPLLAAAGILETARARAAVGELRAGHGKETDNLLLQHTFGNFVQGDSLLSDRQVGLLTTFRDQLHTSINPR